MKATLWRPAHPWYSCCRSEGGMGTASTARRTRCLDARGGGSGIRAIHAQIDEISSHVEECEAEGNTPQLGGGAAHGAPSAESSSVGATPGDTSEQRKHRGDGEARQRVARRRRESNAKQLTAAVLHAAQRHHGASRERSGSASN
eukprot:960034-Prymnesium_polylepis.1